MADDLRVRLHEVLSAHDPQRVDMPEARDAAVLIPIVAVPEPTLIFTVRTDTLSSHKGQISFPGGAIDATDPSPEAAALRETQEELGLDPASVEVLGELDTTPTFVTGYLVFPFVGWIERPPALDPNPAEVKEVLEVPITDLSGRIRREPGFEHRGRSYPTEAWVWNDYVIWGVTARLIRQFLDKVAATGYVEAPGDTTSWGAWPAPSAPS